jgi:tellurite resistance protein TehA-like permease
MNKLIQAILLGIVGLVVITAAGPALTKLVSALVPLVLVLGIVIAVLRVVWHYTR